MAQAKTRNADISETINGDKGGTGVANTGKTITLGGNLTTGGALTLTTAGSATTYLNGAGAYTTPAGGGGSPGGSDTQWQYNNAGSFGGDQDVTRDASGGSGGIRASALSLGAVNVYANMDATGGFFYVDSTTNLSAQLNSNLSLTDGNTGSITTITANYVQTGIGGSTSSGKTLVTANIGTTNVGNVGTGTDDLMTYSLPANAFSTNGKGVRITAWGTTANNANAKTLTLNFGSTIMFTRAMTVSAANRWVIEVVVFRTGSNAQKYQVTNLRDGSTSSLTPNGGTSAQTDTSAITIKCTGNATANNDIVQEGFLIEMIN